MNKIKILCASLLFSLPYLSAENALSRFTDNALLKNANISLLVQDLKTGKVLSDFRSGNSAVTASTMKVITTATALEMLGPDFHFQTKLEIDGEITKDSTLVGNLYIYGGGDPTLGSEKLGNPDFLTEWTAAVRKAGIRHITGRIVANPGIYDKEVINPKWTWEDMGNYYAPGIHGIAYLDNTYRAYFNSAGAGKLTELVKIEPEIPELSIDNYVRSANVNSDNAYFYGAPFAYHRYVMGEIPANRTNFAVKGDIPEPALVLARDFQTQLAASGCKVDQAPAVEYDTDCKKYIIYTYESPALKDIITETNVKSNNLYAEYLFKYIGSTVQIPSTIDLSVATIRKFWKAKGLPVDQLFQCDGSGLSPADGVSANFFVQLLSYMKNKSKNADVFYNSLPVSGESGTLKSFLDGTSLQGKVHAKSGTIERVKSYAGYIETKNGTLVFALLVNNPFGTSKEVVKKMENFLLDVANGK